MLKDEMRTALSAQVNEELFSAYLYASMVNYFEAFNLKGFAHWMRLQSEEELGHARKIVDYLNDRGGKVVLTAIAAPQAEWDSPLAVFENSYAHECHISECINKLTTMSLKLDDHATHAFLEWFVTEQVEEEANVDTVVQQLKLIEGAPGALFLLDHEVGQRSPGGDSA